MIRALENIPVFLIGVLGLIAVDCWRLTHDRYFLAQAAVCCAVAGALIYLGGI